MKACLAALSAAAWSALGAPFACSPGAVTPSPSPAASLAAQVGSAKGAAATPIVTACHTDMDCGYDPPSGRCGSDPRYNRQPPIADQGVMCFCDSAAQACQTLRIWPIPCEGDTSCAVSLDPRPHPIAATLAHPHERGKPCVDFAYATTCERTNICTMHRLSCADGGAR